MIRCKKLLVTSYKKFYDKYRFKGDIKRDAVNADCFMYDFFMTEDAPLFFKELLDAKLVVYEFDISKVGIGQTKVCPWCHIKKTKVDDWPLHCKQCHPKIDSTDCLRRVFAGYKVQHTIYKMLAARLIKNWKQLAFLEGGCYRCMDTDVLFNKEKNVAPRRCVRMDTPKSNTRDIAFIGINVKKFKKVYGLGKDTLVGVIANWRKKCS